MKRSRPLDRHAAAKRYENRLRAEGHHKYRRIGRSAAPKRQSFSEKYDGTGPRYGTLFVTVRDMPCWLAEEGYSGPGHERCGRGVQGGHTAHHIGREDAEGLISVCGRGHDLVAGLGGRTTIQRFREWLAGKGFRLTDVAMEYVERAREEGRG